MDWLTVTDWLIAWLAHWLIASTGLFTHGRFMLRKEINFNALHDMNQKYWDCWWKWLISHFRSDVSSRCDKTSTATGLRGYLQCHKCCIYCLVIQLSSEPDKLNCWYSLLKVRLRHGFISFLYSYLAKLKPKFKTVWNWCICKMRDTLVKEKTLHCIWVTWILVDFNIYFASCFLFTTNFKTEIQQNFQTQRKSIKHFCF